DAGVPFLANPQAAVFHPLSLFYVLLPFDWGFNGFVLAHYLIAGIGAYLLGRELKLSVGAGLIMSLIFTYSGYLLSVDCMLTTLSAAAWLPLAFIVFRRMLVVWNTQTTSLSRYSAVFLSAVCIGLIYLGGEPTVVYWTGILFLSYAIYFNYQEAVGHSSLLRNFVLAIAPFGLFILLLAVQIVPFIEFAGQCSRIGKYTVDNAGQWSIKPYELLKFFLPYLAFKPGESLGTTQWLRTLYMGILPLMLFPFAFFRREDKSSWFWLAALIISCLVSLGVYFPLYPILTKLMPGLIYLRYPVKYIFPAVLAITVLAGYGFDGFVRAVSQSDKKAKELIDVFFLITFILAEFFFIFFIWQRLAAVKEIALFHNVISLAFSLLFLGGLTILFSKYSKGEIGRSLFIVVLLLTLILDLYTANYDLAFSAPAKQIHFSTQNIDLVSRDKTNFRVLPSPAIDKRSSSWSEDEVRDYAQALPSIRERLFANQTMLAKIENAHGYGSMHLANFIPLSKKIGESRNPRENQLLNLFNIKYVTTDGPVTPAPRGFKLMRNVKESLRDGQIALYENLEVLPREFYVPNAKVLTSKEAVLDYVSSSDFDPRREVVLTEKVTGPFWFAADSYYPGWKAYVNGVETKIYEADYGFRAVPVSGPLDKVEFVYDPLSVKVGAGISILTWLGCLGGLVILWKRK
ncbi:MAG: hypothetical protein ABIE84_01465, partial [bacterium]